MQARASHPDGADAAAIASISPAGDIGACGRAVLAAAIDPVIIIDSDDVIRAAGGDCAGAVGWMPDELIGQPISIFDAVTAGDDAPASLGGAARSANAGHIAPPATIAMRRRDGSIVNVEMRAVAFDATGVDRPLRACALRCPPRPCCDAPSLRFLRTLTTDVGAAPDFDSALRAALRTMCRHREWGRCQIWMLNGRHTRPDARERRVGCGAVGASDTALQIPDSLCAELFEATLGSGGPVIVSDVNAPDAPAQCAALPERTPPIVSLIALPVVVDGLPEALCCFGSPRRVPPGEDLTDLTTALASLGPVFRQRRIEDALRDSEEHHRVAFESSPVGQAQFDPETGLFLRVNPRLCALTGCTADELLGCSLLDLAHPDDRARAAAEYETALRRGDPAFKIEKRCLRKDGSVVWAHMAVAILRRGDRSPRLGIVTVEDVTRQRALRDELDRQRDSLQAIVREQTIALDTSHERLRMADRMATIGTLAAGLGHDMNNMLLPVRAHVNALRASAAQNPSGPTDHIEEISRSVGYLQQLADGLHYLAVDPERTDAESGETDVAEWWRGVGSLLSKSTPKHVRVVASIDPELPSVAIPAHRLTQAVLNLIVNAGEAIPAGQTRPRGRVRLRAARADASTVRVSVSDNGRGMTDEVRRRCFELFYTTKPRGLGTGLGLNLVRRVVEAAGGSIELDSNPGRGTTITMLLPVVPPPLDDPGHVARLAVVVGLPPGRESDLMTHLLAAAGARACPPEDADRAATWITLPDDLDRRRAERWASQRAGRSVVVVQCAAERTGEHLPTRSPARIKDLAIPYTALVRAVHVALGGHTRKGRDDA